METKQNISLKPYNTFGVNVKAAYMVSPRNTEQLPNLIDSSLFNENPVLVLGEGSNVLFTEDFPGVIINLRMRGINIIESTDDYVIVSAGAGKNWHRFVETCLNNNWYGLENLALIPGKVGAAPVQNIGAYGVEQSDFFYSLEGFDLNKKELVTLNKEECNFSYRNSVFKEKLKDKFIVTSVSYKLSKKPVVNISYTELQSEARRFAVTNPDNRYIFDAVIRLRLRKLPQPETLGNAGSFFKNPIISQENYNDIKSRLNGTDVYALPGGDVKISAGRLIESLGWKGKRMGDAGVYEKHALILVNYGSASGQDILNLANEIEASVFDRFGIKLESEVRII